MIIQKLIFVIAKFHTKKTKIPKVLHFELKINLV